MKFFLGQIFFSRWVVRLQKFVLMTIDPFLAELLRQLEEFDANISALQKTKIQLTNQLEEAKRLCDEESKERQSLMGRFRTLEHEFDGKYAFLFI